MRDISLQIKSISSIDFLNVHYFLFRSMTSQGLVAFAPNSCSIKNKISIGGGLPGFGPTAHFVMVGVNSFGKCRGSLGEPICTG